MKLVTAVGVGAAIGYGLYWFNLLPASVESFAAQSSGGWYAAAIGAGAGFAAWKVL